MEGASIVSGGGSPALSKISTGAQAQLVAWSAPDARIIFKIDGQKCLAYGGGCRHF